MRARERRASVQKAHVSHMSNISNTLTDSASLDLRRCGEVCGYPVLCSAPSSPDAIY